MCGIVGFLSEQNTSLDLIIQGLDNLEYRGYDSCGVAYIQENQLKVCKKAGRIKELKKYTEQKSSTVGIGHTRWATHGEANQANAHPHLSNDKAIAVVHNGIIHNNDKIKQMLIDKGFAFISQTDTEIIPNMIQSYLSDGCDLKSSVIEACKQLKGAFALLVLSKAYPDKLICIKYGSPLIFGKNDASYYIASDIDTVSINSQSYYCMQDRQIAILSNQGVELFDFEGVSIQPNFKTNQTQQTRPGKNGYDTFMLKEIHDIPHSVRASYNSTKVFLEQLDFNVKERFGQIDSVVFVACGTAYHAAMYGKYILQSYSNLHCTCEIASEFSGTNCINENTLIVAISQSGETADTINAIKLTKQKGCYVLGIVNQQNSTICELVDSLIYLNAGKEIAVASTKALNSQLVVLYYFCMYLSKLKNPLIEFDDSQFDSDLQCQSILSQIGDIQKLTKYFENKDTIMFLGRGIDYTLAQEASLKVREIAYINTQAYPSGELKHGSLALVLPDVLVVCFITDFAQLDKSVSALREVKARGATVLLISSIKNIDLSCYDFLFSICDQNKMTSIFAIVPLQLLSYFVAKDRGCDIDKPRNLAKSVTVD
jgi:glucosamine--fructose-6-phosphate aminotransferase (isomerizing)